MKTLRNTGPAPLGAVARAPRPRERRVRRLAAGVRAAAVRHPTWLEWLTRLGYAARGIVYLVVGGTGLFLAVGLAEQGRGSPGVMRFVVALPMGRVLLGALTVGLVGYSVLSLLAAVRAPEGQPGVRGVFVRVGDAAAGTVYAALAALAVRLLADPTADPKIASELWAARLLALPGGPALLGAAGLVTVAVGAYLGYKAVALPVLEHLERRRVPARVVRVVARLARAGIGARAVLFALCGWLLLDAAWTGDPRRVGGLGEALTALAGAPAGPALVAVVAAGCVAYGIYQFAKARYRRIRLSAPAGA